MSEGDRGGRRGGLRRGVYFGGRVGDMGGGGEEVDGGGDGVLMISDGTYECEELVDLRDGGG